MMPPYLPLSAVQPGSRCVIRTMPDGCGRMLDLGLVPDTEVMMVRQAPLAGPLAFRLRGFCLSLRQSEAERILVEEVT